VCVCVRVFLYVSDVDAHMCQVFLLAFVLAHMQHQTLASSTWQSADKLRFAARSGLTNSILAWWNFKFHF